MIKRFFCPDSVPFHQCIGGFEQLAHLLRIRKQTGGLFFPMQAMIATLAGFPAWRSAA